MSEDELLSAGEIEDAIRALRILSGLERGMAPTVLPSGKVPSSNVAEAMQALAVGPRTDSAARGKALRDLQRLLVSEGEIGRSGALVFERVVDSYQALAPGDKAVL